MVACSYCQSNNFFTSYDHYMVLSVYAHNNLSCRRKTAMLRVIEYFAKSLKITQGHSKWYYSKALVVSYSLFIVLWLYLVSLLR